MSQTTITLLFLAFAIVSFILERIPLGLTATMVLPHSQMVKDDVLDGLRVFEDITYPDSVGRSFYALVDGSYLFLHDGVEELRGEAYLIRDGNLQQISAVGERLSLS